MDWRGQGREGQWNVEEVTVRSCDVGVWGDRPLVHARAFVCVTIRLLCVRFLINGMCVYFVRVRLYVRVCLFVSATRGRACVV